MRKEIFLAKYGSKEHIDNAIGKDNNIDGMIAQNPFLTKEHTDILIKNHDTFVRGKLIENTPKKEHLDILVKDPFLPIQRGIIYNKHATAEHLEHQMGYDDEIPNNYIHHIIANHPNASKKQLEHIANSHSSVSTGNIARKRLENGDYK